ncbi:MAG: hypothetical protein LBO66_14195 [Deltaproteobacteria bacterium]|jgi:hypothetical protein|nr:hypothetical protein [Deltaproteobacteria bacterium]
MKYRNPYPNGKILKMHKTCDNYFHNLASRLTNINNFTNIDDIEHNYKKFDIAINELFDSTSSYILSNCKEKEMIKFIKNEYKKYGISLKINVRNTIKIQTEDQLLSIKRTLLIPATSEDRELLFKKDGKCGIYPLDRFLKISDLPFKLTVGAMLKVSEKAITASSFESASQSLKKDCGIKICANTIKYVTEHIGYIVFKHNYEMAFQRHVDLLNNKIIFPAEKCQGVLYLQVDGSMISTREKDKAGSRFRETKLGLIYNSFNMTPIERTNKLGNRVTEFQIIQKDYTAYIGAANEFQKFFFDLACRNGYGLFKETVLISDGAKWIDTMKQELFPDAVHILDFFHLSEKIWEIGRAYFKIKDDAKLDENYNNYVDWCHYIISNMENSNYNYIRKDIESKEMKVNKAKYKEDKINLIKYIDNNIDKIDYKNYMKRGYSIGSGAIEGSNKNVIQQRLKLSGMHWNRSSAQGIAILRSKLNSNRWNNDVVIPVRNYYNLKIRK